MLYRLSFRLSTRSNYQLLMEKMKFFQIFDCTQETRRATPIHGGIVEKRTIFPFQPQYNQSASVFLRGSISFYIAKIWAKIVNFYKSYKLSFLMYFGPQNSNLDLVFLNFSYFFSFSTYFKIFKKIDCNAIQMISNVKFDAGNEFGMPENPLYTIIGRIKPSSIKQP